MSRLTGLNLAEIEALEKNAYARVPLNEFLEEAIDGYARAVGLDPRYTLELMRAQSPDLSVPRQAGPITNVDPLFLSEADLDQDTDTQTDVPLQTDPFPSESDLEREQEASVARPMLRGHSIAVGVTGGLLVAVAAGVPVVYKNIRTVPAAAEAGRTPGPLQPVGGGTRSTAQGQPMTVPLAESATDPDPSSTRHRQPALPEAFRDAAPELSGIWKLDTRVESSNVDAFRGLRLSYRLQLREDGNRISGTGFKVTENGRPLRNAARTPINIEGAREGEQLSLTFTERGTRRESSGTLVLVQQSDQILRGHFASDAARSSGTVEAQRE